MSSPSWGCGKLKKSRILFLSLFYWIAMKKRNIRGFSSNSRKLEFLSVRALLSELIGKDAKIVYNKNNKPFLKDGSRFISISHSHKLTAILLKHK
jgi:phosphopantetheinyl transferase